MLRKPTLWHLSIVFAGVLAWPVARAQDVTLTRADTGLIGRILLAEDRRDSLDASIADGAKHGDARVREIARRALWRIRDPRFAARDSLRALPAPTALPEPAWRLRYRALTPQTVTCDKINVALADSAWPVRLRAADLTTAACANDAAIASAMRTWVAGLPATTASRKTGQVSWHAGAHALLALTRLQPMDARPHVVRLSRHSDWHVRLYAARAASILADLTLLRTMTRDANDNVREAAVEGLSRLAGHADDDAYVAVITDRRAGPQAVRAAAIALKGSPRTDAASIAMSAFTRWVARSSATEADARVALLAAAGRPTTEDKSPAVKVELPPRAVALALGEDVRLRVAMSPASGGGSFVVRLRGDVAPMTAARILALAKSGYYNGLTWHRVEHDFVIQGGSKGDNEYVGLPSFFRDELGTVAHLRGTVGMSTRGHDTGDAQWFVNLRDNLRLGRDYTVFGEVVEGIDVVDGVLEGDAIHSITVLRAKR